MNNKGNSLRFLVTVTILISIQLACSLLSFTNEPPESSDQFDLVLDIEFVERPTVSDNAMGDPNAPIRIEEFSDYQCLHCLRFFEDTEGQIIDEYVATGKVHFVFRSFGEFLGPESKAAAEAAYCAGDQDRYWEYHDLLYANQKGENEGAYTNQRLETIANALSLDMDTFIDCFKGGKYADRVEQDNLDGSSAGISGTPSFVISYQVNGDEKQRLIFGAYPFSEFQNQIESALAEIEPK